jgi:hypothetical protein
MSIASLPLADRLKTIRRAVCGATTMRVGHIDLPAEVVCRYRHAQRRGRRPAPVCRVS